MDKAEIVRPLRDGANAGKTTEDESNEGKDSGRLWLHHALEMAKTLIISNESSTSGNAVGQVEVEQEPNEEHDSEGEKQASLDPKK
jgi:hypothetical protein